MAKKIFYCLFINPKTYCINYSFFSIFSMAKGGEGLTSPPPGISGDGSSDTFGTLTDLAK